MPVRSPQEKLAAAGLFGVLSYIVAQRSCEIGIRIALGAQRQQVLRGMLVDGLRPAVIGLLLGLAASAATTQFIKSMLYETRPLDPGVFVAVAALLMASAGAGLHSSGVAGVSTGPDAGLEDGVRRIRAFPRGDLPWITSWVTKSRHRLTKKFVWIHRGTRYGEVAAGVPASKRSKINNGESTG
jgi:ABC-type antimicrobial peptide transport system permease subunit